MIHSELGKMEELSQLISCEAWSTFKKTYGHILDLLYITVEALVLSALIEFRKSSLHYFELPKLDITLVIEEYTTKLTSVQTDQMVIEERGSTQGLRKDFLESHLKALA